MTDTRPPPIPPATPEPPDTGSDGALAFRQVLRIIFGYPQLLMVLLQANWRRALVRVAAVSFICGLLVGISQIQEVAHGIMEWAHWLRGNVDTMRVQDDRVEWERSEDLPATDHFRGWRVDFRRGEEAEFHPGQNMGTYPRGIWVSPTKVLLWYRTDKSTPLQTRVLFDEGKTWASVPVENFSVAGDEFIAKARQMLRYYVPVFLVAQGLNVLLQMLLYVSIFAVIPCLLKSPLAAGGFKSIFTFYLYASLPALAVATAYSAAGIEALDFNTIFVGAFIMYLVFAMWRLGRALRTPQSGA